jgi:hypothetical protein
MSLIYLKAYGIICLLKTFGLKLKVGKARLVSWRDIHDAFVLDQSSTLARGAVRLSSRHIAPNSFERMSVKLAVQVFSESTAALMLTAIETQQLTSPTAEWTAKFIRELNHLFDALNSCQKTVKTPNNCAISYQHRIVRECLDNASKFIDTWVVSAKTAKTRLRPPCFDGLKNTIKGILALWKDLESEGSEFLLTSRLNQDPLECTFSVIRGRVRP